MASVGAKAHGEREGKMYYFSIITCENKSTCGKFLFLNFEVVLIS